jgi:hypothetical protein
MCISVLSPNIYIWLNFITSSNFMFLKSFMVVVLKDVLYTLLKYFFINVYVVFINVYVTVISSEWIFHELSQRTYWGYTQCNILILE